MPFARFIRCIAVVFLFAMWLALPPPVLAQPGPGANPATPPLSDPGSAERKSADPGKTSASLQTALVTTAQAPELPPLHLVLAPPPPVKLERPAGLLPLYGSLVVLQGLDMHSTRRALANGAREVNPLMRAAAGHDGLMIAAKVAGTAGVVWATEKMWRKKQRRLAVITALVLNGVGTAVVLHNYRVERR